MAKTYRWNSIPEGIFQLMRPTNTWTRWNFSYTKADSDDTHGYNALETYSACEITIEEMENISRELYEEGKAKELVDYNKESLEKFLSLTKENGIDVWFFNAPTAVKATNSSMKIFEEICAQYDHVKYCDNMALEMIEMGLTEEDFYDEGHLNRRGAEKFTQYYSEILGERIWGITPEWDKAFGYKTESVTELENGQYCYEMINYSNDCLYMFELRKDGSLVDRQDYSEDNTYICSEDIRFSEEYELYCAMIPASDKELENGSPSRIKIPFLKLNASVID